MKKIVLAITLFPFLVLFLGVEFGFSQEPFLMQGDSIRLIAPPYFPAQTENTGMLTEVCNDSLFFMRKGKPALSLFGRFKNLKWSAALKPMA